LFFSDDETGKSNQSTLTVLSPTNRRLNSCLHHIQKPINPSKQGRRVAFTKEGAASQAKKTDVAMAKAKQQAKWKGNWRGPKTPPMQVEEEKMPVIGSSCTWRDKELDHLKVKVVTGVEAKEMIPEKFLEFGHLMDYNECILLLLVLVG
jgi:hypothetical protein